MILSIKVKRKQKKNKNKYSTQSIQKCINVHHTFSSTPHPPKQTSHNNSSTLTCKFQYNNISKSGAPNFKHMSHVFQNIQTYQ